jgi:hypothetical protein
LIDPLVSRLTVFELDKSGEYQPVARLAVRARADFDAAGSPEQPLDVRGAADRIAVQLDRMLGSRSGHHRSVRVRRRGRRVRWFPSFS